MHSCWSNIVVMAETPAKSLASPVHNNRVEDELLVKKFVGGDDSVFDRIVEEYSADIAVLANRLLGWPGDVDDIVQEIFLAAFVGLKKFRCQCSLKTWLFTITINKCRSYRYKQMLRLRTLIDRISPAPVSAVDKTHIDGETFEHVRRVIKALPPKYREPVVLRYLQELSIDKISQLLGVSQNTLQVRLNRARGQLKKNLAELIMEKKL